MREREQIVSHDLHLAINTHFMFTDEFAEEMASFRAIGKGDVHSKPVRFTSMKWDETKKFSLKSL